jgi:hypothetical protein
VGGSGGFTELNDINSTNPGIDMQTQSRTGSVSATVDWSVSGDGSTSRAVLRLK